MASSSPRRLTRISGSIVRPQPLSDKTVVENVMDYLFQDFGQNKSSENKERITWVQFEQPSATDFLKLCKSTSQPISKDLSTSQTPLLLILGYTNGLQVWIILEDGEAQEVISLRQGPLKHFKFLTTPTLAPESDLFSTKRPLVATTEATGSGHNYSILKLVSLTTGQEVHSINCKSSIFDIYSSERVLVVTHLGKVAVYEASSFNLKFYILNCYPSPGIDPNPVALGTRWLAYADKNLSQLHQSYGGLTSEDVQSYTASLIQAAKTFKKGLTVLSESIANSVSFQSNSATRKKGDFANQSYSSIQSRSGIVSIVDVMKIEDEEISVTDYWDGKGLIGHFVAHNNEPLTSLTFDSSGSLLLTSDKQGRSFHLFKIQVHPESSSLTSVHHLYVLRRGETTSKIQSTCFTWDSRWVAMTTCNGTTHLFPVTCYGGPINKRTHMTSKVVSRSSRFQTTTGLDDSTAHFKKVELKNFGNPKVPSSPVPSSCGSSISKTSPPSNSPSSKMMEQQFHQQQQQQHQLHQQQLQKQFLLNHTINPRLPPFPQPITIHPLAQIHQSASSISSDVNTSTKGSISTSSSSSSSSVRSSCDPRLVVSSFHSKQTSFLPMATLPNDTYHYADSIFIMAASGLLTEHLLKVTPKCDLEKITNDSPIQLEAQTFQRWNLSRCHSMKELTLPLSPTNPLITSFETHVTLQQQKQQLLWQQQQQQQQQDLFSLEMDEGFGEEWLSQVEIVTHSTPHRRLCTGPQFTFKTLNNYNNNNDSIGNNNNENNKSTHSLSSCSSSSSSSSSSLSKNNCDVFENKNKSENKKFSKPLQIKKAGSGQATSSYTTLAITSTFKTVPSFSNTYIETFDSGSFSNHSSLETRWFDSSLKMTSNQQDSSLGVKLRERLAEAIEDDGNNLIGDLGLDSDQSEEGQITKGENKKNKKTKQLNQVNCEDSWSGCLGYQGKKKTGKQKKENEEEEEEEQNQKKKDEENEEEEEDEISSY